MRQIYSADGSVEEQRERKRRKNVACHNCHHPWAEHKFGKQCRMRKRSGLAAPNHRADCGCMEFQEPPKKRRQWEKVVLHSW